MASRISSIEHHPMRQKIIEALAADTPYRKISAWTDPAVTIGALSRYKQSAIATIQQSIRDAKKAIINSGKDIPEVYGTAVTKAALAVAVDPFAQAALKSAARRERWIEDLEQSPDLDTYKVLATMDRNDLAAQEYAAKLAGRLDSRPVTNIAIVLPAQPGASATAEDGEVIDITVR